MDREKELTKLVNILRRTARMALHYEWTEDAGDTAQFCVDQYNKVFERLKQLEPDVTTVFAPLKSGSSLNVVAIACRQLAAYFEDEVENASPWQAVCAGAIDAESFKDFWRKGACDVQDLGEIIRESISGWTPSYAEYFIGWCSQRGIDIRELGIEKVVVAGEPGGSIPAVREKIETAYHATCVEAMGIGDLSPSIWGECPEAKQGMHFCAQEFIFVELIDPESGEPIDWADGAKGELVYTALDRECVPLIRFRSRDHVEVWATPCVCGRTSPRVRVMGRTDDMLIVLGVNVFPSAIKAVASQFQPQTTGYVEIQLREPGPRIQPPLLVKIEYGSEASDLRKLKADLETALRGKLVFRASVELVPEGTLPRSEYKGRLVRKLYEEPHRS